jgi:hypothetical protein
LGDLATMQAETRVNTEQASKRDVAEADPSGFWGRPLPLDEIATAFNGSAGVVVSACMEEEIDRKTGSPKWWWRVTANQTPVTDRLGQLGWRIGP